MKPFQRLETHFFICQYINQTKICLKHVCFSACLSVINCFLSSLSANLSKPFNVLESGLLLCLSVFMSIYHRLLFRQYNELLT